MARKCDPAAPATAGEKDQPQVNPEEQLEGAQVEQPLAIPLADMSEISLTVLSEWHSGQRGGGAPPLTNSSNRVPQS